MKILNFKLGILVSVFLFCSSIQAQEKLYPNEFPPAAVKLLDGPLKHAADLNIQTLLAYDVDRLLAPYRKEAGLPEPEYREYFGGIELAFYKNRFLLQKNFVQFVKFAGKKTSWIS